MESEETKRTKRRGTGGGVRTTDDVTLVEDTPPATPEPAQPKQLSKRQILELRAESRRKYPQGHDPSRGELLEAGWYSLRVRPGAVCASYVLHDGTEVTKGEDPLLRQLTEGRARDFSRPESPLELEAASPPEE